MIMWSRTASIDWYYKVVDRLHSGICVDDKLFIQRNKDSSIVRFVSLWDTLTVSHTELSDRTSFTMQPSYNGVQITSPSDTVLGLPSVYLQLNRVNYSKIYQYSCSSTIVDRINGIDNLYSSILGFKINQDFYIQPDFSAVSTKIHNNVSKLAIKYINSKSMIIYGFPGNNTVTVNADQTTSHESISALQYDSSPSSQQLVRKPPQHRHPMYGRIVQKKFTRSGTNDDDEIFIAQVELWKESHKAIIIKETVLVTDIKNFMVTGCSEVLKTSGYDFKLGRVESLPDMGKKIRDWKYFTSLFVHEVYTGDNNVELKKKVEDPQIVNKYVEIWNTMFGKICLINSGGHKGEKAYVTADFQILTFTGQLLSVEFVGKYNECNGRLYDYKINNCDLL
jgi:hypothetical protein